MALLALLYFINVWFQLSIRIVGDYGLGVIFIALVILLAFIFAFIYVSHTVNIYKLLLWAFIFYLAWGLIFQVAQSSDFSTFYKNALQFSKTMNFKYVEESKSTTTVLYYGIFFNVLGKSPLASYIASSCAWVFGYLFFYKSLINFHVRKNHAILFLIIGMFAPSTIAFSTIVSSESVFILLLSLSLYFLSKYFTSKNIYNLAIVSLTLGLLFITRSNGIAFFVAFIIILVCSMQSHCPKNPIRAIAYSVLPFIGALLLQGYLNYSYTEKFSVSTSPHGVYNFLAGTNRETRGGYSAEDRELAGYRGANKVSYEEANKKAMQIAIHRITNDPADFIYFALTKKINKLWGNDTYGINRSLTRSPKRADMGSSGMMRVLRIVASAYYMLMVSLFVIWLVLRIRKNYVELGMLCLPLMGLALLHIFIEVQARYHVPFMPFIYFGAAGTLIILRQKIDDINTKNPI